MRRLSHLLGPALVPLWVLLIAAAILLPDLPRPGLWEPNELAVADAAVARNERALHPTPTPPTPPAPPQTMMQRFAAWKPTACAKTPPADATARTMTDRLVSTGLALDDSDGGMRFPIALLGILCVLATAGIAMRLGSGRAGLYAGLACLSFPMFALDARMLIGDIGTPTGASLIVYGAVALATLRRDAWLLVDLLVAFAAIAAGAGIAFHGGGALLGLVVPAIAIAIAGGFGVRIGAGGRDPRVSAIALLATIATGVLVYVLASQMYTITFPTPGERELFGHSVIPSDCWSTALGGLWRVDDDMRMSVDSVFEQIAFGTFPVGVLAPIALFALATTGDERRGHAGRLALAWAAAAWIATQVWHRKVGFALWPGFPPLAVAIGVWIDQLLVDREPGHGGAEPRTHAPPLLALFVIAAVATIAVDVWAFPDRITSLLIGSDTIKYPKSARLLHVPLRVWAIAIGVGFAMLFAAGAWLWRPGPDARPAPVRWLARHGLRAAAASMAAIAVFWVWGWHDTMSHHLSSKHLFSVYRDLRQDGDTLGIMGDLGNAPRYYAGGTWETIPGRDQLMKFLARPTRVFALAPASELCAIHRSAQGKPYFVLDDSNPRTLLLSNKVDGAEDVNSLTRTVLRAEPKGIGKKPPSPIVFDDKIELIGWTVPERSSWGTTIRVTLYFKVRANVSGSWKIFEHFDPQGGGPRFQGDHDPIGGRCATSYWQTGDYVVDEAEVEASGVGLNPGPYELWIGFFTGTNPNWTNMHITQAPPGAKDNAERVHLGTIVFD